MTILAILSGALLGIGLIGFLQKFPEPLNLSLMLKISTVGLCSLLLLALATGKIDPLSFWLLLMSLQLSLYDSQTKSFPLIVWMAYLPMIMMLGQLKPMVIVLALLGMLAELIDLKIGSGDLFYLTSLSFSLSVQDLLWLIQLASFLGIAYILFQKKEGTIAFLPFLSLGYIIVLFI